MSQEHYVIEGGQKGKDRLKILSRALQPTTIQLLQRAGLTEGMHALDVGCGGGDVTLDMARMVGKVGRVLGFDFDGDILQLARRDAEAAKLPQVEFRVADALKHETPPTFDVVYARFLLTHLPDPERGLAGMIHAARPAGTVVAEDIDFRGHFCYPPNDAFQRYLGLYTETVRLRGGDAEIGARLPGLFLNAGLKDVQVNIVQPVHLSGEGKLIAEVTMARIGDAVVRAGLAATDEVERIVADISTFAARPDTLIGYPRVVQVWGVRPS